MGSAGNCNLGANLIWLATTSGVPDGDVSVRNAMFNCVENHIARNIAYFLEDYSS